MPGRNGWGPMGQGPMTGRGQGWCGGAARPTEYRSGSGGFGAGRGQGRGGGWRFRRGFCATGLTSVQHASAGQAGAEARGAATVADEEPLDMLRQQAAGLQRALGALSSRIAELEASTLGTAKKVPE